MDIQDSARLSFRLMGQEDAQALWEIDQDPEVMHYLNGGKPNSMETIKEVFLPRMKSYTDVKKGHGIWQVIDKNTQEYLGWVLIRPMAFFTDEPDFSNLELGWRFFKKAWGKGYATEAAIAVKETVASPKNIQYVSALAVEDNLASISVMKKIGMSFVKQYAHKDPIGDFNAVHYQMSVK